MKRRTFGLFAGTSMLALTAAGKSASAQAAGAGFAALSKTTLTPVGAERAGNGSGTIPEWTGGMTSLPAGVNWDPNSQTVPDFWASEAPLYVVNASNMSQYADLLTDGVQMLIQKQGLSLKVYPTHRTAAYPQWVYDNIMANSSRAQLNPAGGRLGFSGGYGGIPFPVPDTSDPFAAGAQIMWNHVTKWAGSSSSVETRAYAVSSGQLQLFSDAAHEYFYPYYQQNGTLDGYNGFVYYEALQFNKPETVTGTQLIAYYATNPLKTPNIVWQLLPGQARVRKAPELAYDTPSSYTNGIANFDEYSGFKGALDRYDWKLVGKKEMLIPYNNNKMVNTAAEIVHMPKFLNPDVVRWELHRVWVVEATLHPGERNILARRMMYVDEDTWSLALADCWDANGTIYKEDMVFNAVYPNLPGTILLNSAVYNLQTGDYATITGPWGGCSPWVFGPLSASVFEPQAMAAASSY